MNSVSAFSNYQNNFELFENKTILILGGTGYLGRAIATEILQYNPAKIIIFSRDEVKHFNLEKCFHKNSKIQSILGDIRDYYALLSAMVGVNIVFHVAALKRMDSLESNVEEAIKTNILASINVFRACVESNVEKALFISTDKACLPINAYGACKFVSEKLFTNYDSSKISTKFMVVRFGNILESTGSVIPIFSEKIKLGEEIPLTSDQMTRFIINKKEAVSLIFDAIRYGNGGEIFVKRLPAMKITDLVDVLKMHFNSDNSVRVIGLRPGEKIHERLISESEMQRAIQFNDDLFIIRPTVVNLFCSAENIPSYMKEAKDIQNISWREYSSDLEPISKDELASIINKLSILELKGNEYEKNNSPGHDYFCHNF